MKTFRIALSAALGAAFSTALTVLGPPPFASFITGVISSALMCLAAFGKESISLFVKRFAALWIVGLMLGGLMTFLMSGASNRVHTQNSEMSKTSAAGFIPLAVLLCAFLLYSLSRVTSKKKITVKVDVFGITETLSGLVDSGNLLRDPLSGEPVIVVALSASLKFLSHEDVRRIREGVFDDGFEYLASRYRIVPAQGVAGQIMLNCIRPDSVIICGKRCSAVLAITNDTSFGESIECIVPAVLL